MKNIICFLCFPYCNYCPSFTQFIWVWKVMSSQTISLSTCIVFVLLTGNGVQDFQVKIIHSTDAWKHKGLWIHETVLYYLFYTWSLRVFTWTLGEGEQAQVLWPCLLTPSSLSSWAWHLHIVCPYAVSPRLITFAEKHHWSFEVSVSIDICSA